MRTSIDLPEALFRKAKLEAIHRNITLKELITNALQKEIGAESARRRTLTTPPVVLADTGKIQAISNAEAAALFEDEDLAKAIP